MYPDCLTQAIYATFLEAFPESSHLFNDEFKEDLGNNIFLWMSGNDCHLIIILLKLSDCSILFILVKKFIVLCLTKHSILMSMFQNNNAYLMSSKNSHTILYLADKYFKLLFWLVFL